MNKTTLMTTASILGIFVGLDYSSIFNMNWEQNSIKFITEVIKKNF
jgi:hypothetical protein